ncbi:MAG: NADP-specific glutamate dehydrogenase, partial [Oscillospiraceae bacterium]|nr:NADP-specific glutamate dehydrogenase [Oscillospiraceae bacterium]
MSYIKTQIEQIINNSPYEPEFHQSVIEMLKSLENFIEKNPVYKQNNIIERISEPDRQIKFKVFWHDDRGNICVNRGYRVQFNNTLGPYKGGLRFHPTVNLSVMKFLGFEQIFKNSLTGLPIGGAKGGSDFDPKGKSENEIMRFCQSFMLELYRYIGPDIDIPAGDMGVGVREIGYLFGTYKRIKNVYEGALTGKSLLYGGSLVRKESTGYGLVYILDEMLKRHNISLENKIVSVSGAGNVALHAALKATEMKAKVVTMSDSFGWIYDKDGIDLGVIREIKEKKRLKLSEYIKYKPNCVCKEGKFNWVVPCDIALPCATQNELTLDGAKNLIKNKVTAVAEGANMPTTIDATNLFLDQKVLFLPGKASNAGGVATSALEMSQNSTRTSWEADCVDKELKKI